MKNINPTQTQAWKALEAHFAANKERQLKDLFAADAERFNKFSTTFGGDMLVDYSKNLITQGKCEQVSQEQKMKILVI